MGFELRVAHFWSMPWVELSIVGSGLAMALGMHMHMAKTQCTQEVPA